MEQFIEFIIDLANEELSDYLDRDAKEYFLHGGCFEFAKIVRKYVKRCDIVINEDLNHCGIIFDGNIYDATGKIKETQGFRKANNEDIEYMKDRFGIPEKTYIQGEKVSNYLIRELKHCNIDNMIKNIEREYDEER